MPSGVTAQPRLLPSDSSGAKNTGPPSKPLSAKKDEQKRPKAGKVEVKLTISAPLVVKVILPNSVPVLLMAFSIKFLPPITFQFLSNWNRETLAPVICPVTVVEKSDLVVLPNS